MAVVGPKTHMAVLYGYARGTSPAFKTVAVGDNFRSIRQLPDIADAVPQVETGIAAAMLAEGVSVRFRGRGVIRFNRAAVFFQHPIQTVVKCLKFHDAIVLTHAQPVPVERVRHDVAGWMLHLHQPVFSVPRVGRQVAARLFDGQLVAIGVVRVRGRAGDIRGVQQSVGTVIGLTRFLLCNVNQHKISRYLSIQFAIADHSESDHGADASSSARNALKVAPHHPRRKTRTMVIRMSRHSDLEHTFRRMRSRAERVEALLHAKPISVNIFLRYRRLLRCHRPFVR
jgi:hypothetical protein